MRLARLRIANICPFLSDHDVGSGVFRIDSEFHVFHILVHGIKRYLVLGEIGQRMPIRDEEMTFLMIPYLAFC